MSTTKTWLQAISWIQTRKQSTISISSNDCVSSLLSMVKLLFQKSKRSILVSTIRIKFGLGPDGKLKFPSHQHETHVFRSWTVRYIHRKPLWRSGGGGVFHC
ncbi:hypothetical protein N665_2064s0001 [Sinapis alba]|nr:hypothetical protein N665_2064s0001 [Sinapis alba]